ncbi:Uncharacterized protein Adt_10829 [Abeliophyllum distichum]|uniref:Uncharacterized protein n=1 Tax=Abeliophyllum distichum TaxID=126358 RepID=A0ABD1ULB8_9LAMI
MTVSKETIEPPKGQDEVTGNNIMGLSHDNGVVEYKDEYDNDMLPELKDDGVEYPVDDEALIVRHAFQAQIKIENLEQRFDLDELDDVSSEKISSRLPPIRDIAHQLHYVAGVVILKRPTYRNNSNEMNEFQIHQIKANAADSSLSL